MLEGKKTQKRQALNSAFRFNCSNFTKNDPRDNKTNPGKVTHPSPALFISVFVSLCETEQNGVIIRPHYVIVQKNKLVSEF